MYKSYARADTLFHSTYFQAILGSKWPESGGFMIEHKQNGEDGPTGLVGFWRVGLYL